MSTISNERLGAFILGSQPWNEEIEQMATELLALRKEREKAEPVAYADPQAFRNFKAGTANKEWMWAHPDAGLVPVFAKSTAALVLDDDSLPYDPQIAEYEQMMEAELKAAASTAHKVKTELSQMAEKLVSDTAALAATLNAETDTTTQQFESLAGKAVSGNDGFECTPVADLYELLTKCGECYDYTTSAKVASDWIKEGYSAREYVKLDRLQEALLFAAPEPCE
ncbi:hypothetical protein [Cronobacter turicensis]|uniref:hypothetical protein n=1 Tax=Cronobacter turicensis TaxID=413502 RepID=UPI0011AD2646|nr:hypothetical protein [Cronobacter turicensis]TWR32177.1 hypothetical protein FQY85_18640 [Cronobacter turicensis]